MADETDSVGPTVQRLFPPPPREVALRGLYLAHELRQLPGPVVYTNFISSLDGRISEPEPGTGLRRVPPAIANADDWRLYMELAAQADVLLTTARHLRAVAQGRHGDLLQLDSGPDADLGEWRRARGLPPQPLVAVLSEELAIPLEALRRHYAGPLLVLTSARADRDRLRRLRGAGVEVLVAGPGPGLDGDRIVEALARRGLDAIYSIAGPRVLHTLAEAGRLQRLYLTIANELLGGAAYDTLVSGAVFQPPTGLCLATLYLDPALPQPGGQLFACYESARA